MFKASAKIGLGLTIVNFIKAITLSIKIINRNDDYIFRTR